MIEFTPSRPGVGRVLLCAICLFAVANRGLAQSLDDRLDEDQFLRGLSEYRLKEVLEHYIETHPPADDVEAALFRIAAARMALEAPGLSTAERLQAVEHILDARRELIENHADDPRHAVWLASQATDLFFGLYPIEAAGVTSEFGLPSPAQRRRAERVAREMVDLMRDAEIEIQDTILNLEAEPGYADDIALQLKRRRLAREERDRRIPFLLGVGTLLNAEFNLVDDVERREAFEFAAELLTPLVRELEGDLRVRAMTYAGRALARLGRFDDAEQLFRQAATSADADDADVFAARMGGVINRAVRGGPEAGLEALDSIEAKYREADDLFRLVLITDRRFLYRREIALLARGPERDRLLREAYETYLGLLDADIGVPEETLRTVVFAKLANAAGEDLPLAQLPPLVTVARAQNLAREDATREEAIGLFRQALQRDDLDERVKAIALFGLGRAHYANREWLDAAARFAQVAREHPRDPRAEDAVELAAALLAQLHQHAPDNAEVEAALEEALSLMTERYPNLATIERWRYESGMLRFEDGAYELARREFDMIPPGAEQYLDARFMLARVARAEARSIDDPQEKSRALQRAIEAAQRTRETLRSALEEVASTERRETIDYYLSYLDVFEAEALLALGRPDDAIERLSAVTASGGTDRGVLGEALSLRIKAYQQAGRIDEARREVQRFIDSIPEQVGSVVPSMLVALQRDVERLLEEGRADEATRKAREDLLPFAEALRDWLAGRNLPDEQAAPMHVAAGDAFRLAEQHADALAAYERALDAAPGMLEAVFGRAEALFGLARYEQAIVEFKRISASRASALDRSYWLSELRMLQILDRVDRNTRQITPRIERLRRIDPELGGERSRRGFEALLNKYG